MTPAPVPFLGLELAHPVVNAAGTWDPVAAMRTFGPHPFPFSAFVTPTLTLEARPGTPPPRVWEAAAGILTRTGRPGPGLARYLAEDLPHHAALGVPLIVSIGATTAAEAGALAAGLDHPAIAALELDLTWPGLGATPDLVRALVQTVRRTTTKAVVAKLPAHVADPARNALAAADAGAGALTLTGTVPGAPAYPAAGVAELSGPAIRAVTLGHLAAVAEHVTLPLVAVGGVQHGRDAQALIDAGATLVAVGTASLRDAGAGARIAAELGEARRASPETG